MDEAIKIAIEIGGQTAKTVGLILIILLLSETLKGIGALHDIVTKGRQKSSQAAGSKLRDFAKRADQSRQIRALNGGPVFGRGKYQRRAKREALNNAVGAEANRAQAGYISELAQSDEKFRRKLAGGTPIGGLGATEDAVQRALATAINVQANLEIDEVKAHRATIDKLDEAGLNKVLENSQSNTEKAAALQRLVQIGSMESIAKAVDTVGTSGESNIMTKSLAEALSKDGPGFLKASDIDNIARGQMGQEVRDPATGQVKTDASGNPVKVASRLADMAAENVAAGVYSQKKMAAANANELGYVSDIAQNLAAAGNPQAQQRLQQTATELRANKTLSGEIKHNTVAIEDLEVYGSVQRRP